MAKEKSKVAEVRLLRHRAGLSVAQLAEKAKVSTRFWDYELKRKAPKPLVLHNLAKALAYELYPEADDEEFERHLHRIAWDLLEDAAEIEAEITGRPLVI